MAPRHPRPGLRLGGHRARSSRIGDSAKPRTGYDERSVAATLRALVRELGYEEVSILGHDWGMPTAYSYAAQYPDEVATLTVLEAMLQCIRDDELASFRYVGFHCVRDLPERLVAGNERFYLS